MTFEEYLKKHSHNRNIVAGLLTLKTVMVAMSLRMSEEEFMAVMTLFTEGVLIKDTEREQLREFLAMSHSEADAIAKRVAKEEQRGR